MCFTDSRSNSSSMAVGQWRFESLRFQFALWDDVRVFVFADSMMPLNGRDSKQLRSDQVAAATAAADIDAAAAVAARKREDDGGEITENERTSERKEQSTLCNAVKVSPSSVFPFLGPHTRALGIRARARPCSSARPHRLPFPRS